MPEAPEGQVVDTDSLVLRTAGYNGDEMLDIPMERVADGLACTTTQAEWYYRQDTEPPLLVLCPNGCFEQGGQALLWVRAECL